MLNKIISSSINPEASYFVSTDIVFKHISMYKKIAPKNVSMNDEETNTYNRNFEALYDQALRTLKQKLFRLGFDIDLIDSLNTSFTPAGLSVNATDLQAMIIEQAKRDIEHRNTEKLISTGTEKKTPYGQFSIFMEKPTLMRWN